jgi:hypothetical protein
VLTQSTSTGRIELNRAMTASKSREYCVVMPLRPIAVGGWIDRSHWPQHVTVCPNFRSGPNDIDTLAAVLPHVAAMISRPAATVGEDAQFGPGGDVPVQLVESGNLQRLHVTFMDAFGSVIPVEPVVPDHNGSGYRLQVARARYAGSRPQGLSGRFNAEGSHAHAEERTFTSAAPMRLRITLTRRICQVAPWRHSAQIDVPGGIK